MFGCSISCSCVNGSAGSMCVCGVQILTSRSRMNSSSPGGGKKNRYVWIWGRFRFRYDDCKQSEVQNLKLNSGHSAVWEVTRPVSVNYGWMDENLKHVSQPFVCSLYLICLILCFVSLQHQFYCQFLFLFPWQLLPQVQYYKH